MNKIASYKHLHKFGQALDDGSIDCFRTAYTACLKTGASDVFKAYVGTVLVAGDFEEGRKRFSTNRYFLDALCLGLFPNENDLKALREKLSEAFMVDSENASFQELDEKIKQLFAFDSFDFNSNNTNQFSEHFAVKDLSKEQCEFFDDNGYLIVNNAISEELCKMLATEIAELAKTEADTGEAYFYGSGKAQRIYHLINKSPIFQSVILHPAISALNEHAFCRETLHDKYFLSSFHANILGAGAEAQVIHVDAAVPDPLPPWIIRTNVNFILQDYTKDNGATLCLPGSHKLCKTPNRSVDYTNDLIPLEAKAGALVFWNGHLWHKSGHNQTDLDRLALLGCFAASFLREMVMEENFYCAPGGIDSSSFSQPLKNLLGHDHGIKQ